jgi:hypothetical protein
MRSELRRSLLAAVLALVAANPAPALDVASGDLRVDPSVQVAADATARTALDDMASAHALAIAPAPQPALLIGLGLVGLAFYGRRRRLRGPGRATP